MRVEGREHDIGQRDDVKLWGPIKKKHSTELEEILSSTLNVGLKPKDLNLTPVLILVRRLICDL